MKVGRRLSGSRKEGWEEASWVVGPEELCFSCTEPPPLYKEAYELVQKEHFHCRAACLCVGRGQKFPLPEEEHLAAYWLLWQSFRCNSNPRAAGSAGLGCPSLQVSRLYLHTPVIYLKEIIKDKSCKSVNHPS